MAKIQPFTAWRYNPAKVGDPGDLLAPPYDRIDPFLAEQLTDRHEYNIVRLMPGRFALNEQNSEETASNLGATAARWRQEAIVIPDREPGLYFYRQGWLDREGRHRLSKGFFALLHLETERERVVLHHEADWMSPRVNRQPLLAATRLHPAPILILFADPEREVMSRLTGAAGQTNPCLDTECRDGSTHTLYRLTDRDLIDRVARALAEQRVLLADGHDRYRTAQAYAAANPRNPAAQSILACFMPIEEDGLDLQPIHRAITGLATLRPDDLLFEMSKIFYLRELEKKASPAERIECALRELAAAGAAGKTAFIMGIAGAAELLLLEVKNDAAQLILPEGLAEPIRDLDIALLHRLVLEGPLGLDPRRRELGSLLFFENPYDLPSLLESGKAQIAFLLNSLEVPQLEAVAQANLKLPHKAVRFFPDIPAGVVFQNLDPTAGGIDGSAR